MDPHIFLSIKKSVRYGVFCVRTSRPNNIPVQKTKTKHRPNALKWWTTQYINDFQHKTMQLWVHYIWFTEISKPYDLEKSLLTPVKYNKLVVMRSMPPPKAPASSFKVVEHLHNCAGRLCMKEMSKVKEWV